MKSLTCCLAFILLFSLPVMAQKDKIEQTIIRFFDGLSELDEQKLRDAVTEDFILLELGEVWTLDTLINRIRPLKGVKFKRFNKFDFIKTEWKRSTAWVSYHNWAEMKINDQERKVRWLESAVLIRQKGVWKIKLMHSTQVN